ncbi:MAG: methyltransferase family protein [Candidatus Hodarchaeales archaeon]
MVRSNLKSFIIMLVGASIVSTIILVVIFRIPFIKDIFLEIIFPEKSIIPYPYNLFGLLIIVMGFALTIWANYTLLQKISLEERDPFHIPKALVVNGPYQFSRNPVYLSGIMMAFGLATLLGSLILFILPVFCFIVFQGIFIPWEEKKLEETFGKDYLEFKMRVRRWL